MIKVREVRRLALSLPEAHEADHHGFPSFRVGTKIFATVPDDEHLHVMLGEAEIDQVMAATPKGLEAMWWGKRRAGVRVTLAAVDRNRIAGLLCAAWRLKAPRKLVLRFDAESP